MRDASRSETPRRVGRASGAFYLLAPVVVAFLVELTFNLLRLGHSDWSPVLNRLLSALVFASEVVSGPFAFAPRRFIMVGHIEVVGGILYAAIAALILWAGASRRERCWIGAASLAWCLTGFSGLLMGSWLWGPS